MRALALSVAVILAAGCGSDDAGSGSGVPEDAGPDTDTGADSAVDAGADAPADSPPEAQAPKMILPKSALTADELGVLVNSSDPQSKEVAAYYVAARKIPSANVVTLAFPVGDVMTEADFATAKAAVDAALGPKIQGLAITWTKPYRVACMSVTSAFALGFDKKHCNTTGGACGPTASVPTYDSDSVAPFTDHAVDRKSVV